MTDAMDAGRWQRIKTLFDAAQARSPSERAAFLREACAGDVALRKEVHSLLRAHETAGPADRFLECMDAALHHRPSEEGLMGKRIGPYELVEELGEGGMGRVFLARRADGQFDQQVALKLLGVGFSSPEAKERFLAERQILATLNHPHIARLLDGGVTENGQPYFVMEAVDGQPLDRYADASELSIEERLELFLDVCDAMQSAHQKLVVHRDLKPSNILATDEGRVKLLDFGIAKLLDPELLLRQDAPRTRTGGGPMTPEYASPEQVRGDTISTASDVYQLGVVLYELLTGRRPYSLDGRTPSEVERIVCEEEPPRPSTAIVQGAADGEEKIPRCSETPPEELRRALVGDLDTIVMKTLRKEPDRRYDSVQQLAGDVRRFLAGRPVSAHCDTWAYRGRKFVRRHPWGVAAAAVILLLLVGYGATLTWHSQRTQAALDRAQEEAQKSEQVTDFLVSMFERATPYQAAGPAAQFSDTLTTRELLDRGATRARRELSDQPEVQATLMRTLGRIYRQLGHHDEAEPLLEDALAVQREHLPSTHPDRAKSLHERARLLRYEGRMERAARLYRESLSIQRAHFGTEHPAIADNIRELAIIAAREGRYSKADSLFREALAMRKSLHGPDHPDVATELHVLGLLYVLKEDLAEAEQLLRRSLTIRRTHADGGHPLLAETLDQLGQVLVKQGELDEAEPLLQKARAIRAELFPEVHPSRAAGLNNLGRLFREKDDYVAADEKHREAQAIYRQLYGPENLDLANTLFDRARAHHAMGKYAAADSLYKRALSMQRSLHGPEHPSAQRSREALVELYDAWDRSDKADSLQSFLPDEGRP